MTKWVKNSLQIMAAVMMLGVATNASATVINFFGDGTNTGTNSGVINLAPGSGVYTLNVFANLSDLAYNVFPTFNATGSVTIVAPTLAGGGNCLPQTTGGFAGCLVSASPANQYAFQATEDTVGVGPALVRLATITINVGAGVGSFQFTSGTIVNSSFSDEAIDPSPQVLVNVVPEPGTLLLLATGLSGLVMAGRSRK